MDRDELRKQKGEIAGKLETALKEKFNLQNVSIAHGITWNEDGQPDFAFTIVDLDRPDDFVGNDVVDFAREKVRELAPASKPRISAGTLPRAF